MYTIYFVYSIPKYIVCLHIREGWQCNVLLHTSLFHKYMNHISQSIHNMYIHYILVMAQAVPIILCILI